MNESPAKSIKRTIARIAVIGLCAGIGIAVAAPEAEAGKKRVVKKGFRLKVKPRPRKTVRKKGYRLGKKKTAKQSISPPAPACTIKTSEIIDTRIDIKAQKSLMGKLSRTHAQRREASSMFQAVKKGQLAGMLLNWRKAVADRGARMSPQKGWWQLIPKGKNYTCLKQPTNEAPMIIFRKDLSQAQVDAALSAAWNECGLPLLREPCAYDVDLVKPQDDPVECTTDKDCIDKKIGDFCNTDRNVCGISFSPPTITPGKPKTGQRAKCFSSAHTTWRNQVKSCQDAEFPKLAKCSLENLAKLNAPKLAKCLFDAYTQKESCKRSAFNKYEHQRKNVCPNKPQ